MIEAETRSRDQLSEMFNGEKPILGTEITLFLNSATQQFGLEDFGFDGLSDLPESIILFLQNLLVNLSENSLVLISALKERKAAEKLWERFGLPETSLAVPVFNQLSANLARAHKISLINSTESKRNLLLIINTIRALIVTYYEAELNKLRRKKNENHQAMMEVGASQVVNEAMENRTNQSKSSFATKIRELTREISELRKSQRYWLQFARNLQFKLPKINAVRNLTLNPVPIVANAL